MQFCQLSKHLHWTHFCSNVFHQPCEYGIVLSVRVNVGVQGTLAICEGHCEYKTFSPSLE